jgi:hypothetical protein
MFDERHNFILVRQIYGKREVRYTKYGASNPRIANLSQKLNLNLCAVLIYSASTLYMQVNYTGTFFPPYLIPYPAVVAVLKLLLSPHTYILHGTHTWR